MRKTAIALSVLALISIGAVSYAQMWGDDQGWGGPMMRGQYSQQDQKLLDETADLRKEMHAKRFEFKEALRKGLYEKAEAVEKELEALREKLEAKGLKADGRPGMGRGEGRGKGCGSGRGMDCPGPCGG
ncbi:MAG: hypothetical protein Q8J64_00210 [Thermodesulfovibrionales bacterium]|nr:hypothetical protein [Thermodesulfovibrionales bacterium]